MRIQVKDFMSTPVLTTVGTDKIGEVRKLMERNLINASPVVEINKQLPENSTQIKGVITATDIKSDVDDQTMVTEVMTSRVHVIHQDTSATSAAKMMLKHKVHHLVVMDEGKIVGMISSLDFVGLVAKYALE